MIWGMGDMGEPRPRAGLVLALSLIGCLLAGCSVAMPAATSARPSASDVAAPRTPPGGGLLAVPIPMPPRVTGHYPASCHARTEHGKVLPDRACTPGSINPAVTPSTLRSTICVPGWTRTVRPPESSTGPVKTEAMRAYDEPDSARATTELDHLVPLELGGSDDVTNLWPQPSDLPGHGTSNSKDEVELTLGKAVCAGQASLDAARRAIATDWTTAESTLGVR